MHSRWCESMMEVRLKVVDEGGADAAQLGDASRVASLMVAHSLADGPVSGGNTDLYEVAASACLVVLLAEKIEPTLLE